MDSTTIIIIGVVLFVVIGILRSIAKKNRARRANEQGDGQSDQAQQQQQQPARPSAMSDIQRAFAMMNDEAQEEKPKPRPVPIRPIPARAPAAYASTQGKSTFASGKQPHEGLVGKTEGRASTHEGRIGTTEGRATTHEGKAGRTEGRATTHEGKAGKTEGSEFHGVGSHNMPTPYESTGISTVTFDESDNEFGGAISDAHIMQKTEPLKLFVKQSDYVKAVIFSEILPRRKR